MANLKVIHFFCTQDAPGSPTSVNALASPANALPGEDLPGASYSAGRKGWPLSL